MNVRMMCAVSVLLGLSACATPPAQPTASTADPAPASDFAPDLNYAAVYAHDAASGAFVHKDSGLRLPRLIGNWLLKEAPYRLSPKAAFGLAYGQKAGTLSVFIKAGTNAAQEGVASEVALRMHIRGKKQIQRGTARLNTENGDPGYIFIATPASAPGHQEMVLVVPAGKHLIKLRATLRNLTRDEALAQLVEAANQISQSQVVLEWTDSDTVD